MKNMLPVILGLALGTLGTLATFTILAVGSALGGERADALTLEAAAEPAPAGMQQPAPGPVFLVAHIRIHDRDRYRQYEAGFGEIFDRSGGEVVAFDEAPEVLEGDWPYTRTVLIRFDSAKDLHTWYDSESYQELAQNRFVSSKADIVVVRARPGAGA